MLPQRINTCRRSCLRTLVIGSCCASSLLRVSFAHSATPELTLGCMLDDIAFDKLVGSADLKPEDKILGDENQSASFTISNRSHHIVASSGDRQFDRALAESLYYISELFEITPTFGFIKNAQRPNAYATTKKFTPSNHDQQLPSRDDGTVLMADSILPWMKNKGIDDPVAATIAICAHEFGHIAQYKYRHGNRKISNILRQGESSVRRLELHADFLAGYYIGVARHRNPSTPAATVAYATSVIGDDQVTSFNHHGTPEERGQAIVAGYHAGHDSRIAFKDALVEGLKYVGAI